MTVTSPILFAEFAFSVTQMLPEGSNATDCGCEPVLVSGYSYAPFKALPGVKVFVGPGPWTLTVALVPGVFGLLKVHWLAPPPLELLGLHVWTVACVVEGMDGKNGGFEHVPEGVVPPKIEQRVVGTI